MTDCNVVTISMKPDTFIDLDEERDTEETDIQIYQILIKKLLYLSCNTRLDVNFPVDYLSQQYVDSRIRHFKTTRKILRYLKDTIEMNLEFGTNYVVRNIS